jgi:hypothetical protein
MKPRELYECGMCGAYHRTNFDGDCREDASRIYELRDTDIVISWEDMQKRDFPASTEAPQGTI